MLINSILYFNRKNISKNDSTMYCMVLVFIYIFAIQTTMFKRVHFKKKFYKSVTKLKNNRLKVENRKTRKQNTKNEQEDKVMKTKNNVQKAIIKSLAIVISLVLISFTVSAQNFWKALLENNSLNEIAMFMVDLKPASTANENTTATTMDANTFAAYMETETEETLELEDWMINDNYFAPAAVSMEVDSESPMELENWMTSDNYFGSFANMFEIDTEEPMDLESWMTDRSYFASNVITFEDETEQPLQLEKWMVDNKFWKR